MIPIVSISNLISALFFCGVVLKLYSSYRRNKEENLRNFLVAFALLTILLTLLASPGLIFVNPEIIGLIYAIYPFFGFAVLAYLGIVPLKLMAWEKTKRIFFLTTIIIAFLITLLNLKSFGPAVVHFRDPFVYWEDTRGVAMNITIGGIFSLGLLLIIIFFITYGIKSSERYIRLRAFLITAGLLSLIATSVINFIAGAPAKEYINSLIATIFNIMAGILILLGIYYKPKLSSQN